MHIIGNPSICSTRGMCFHVEYMNVAEIRLVRSLAKIIIPIVSKGFAKKCLLENGCSLNKFSCAKLVDPDLF